MVTSMILLVTTLTLVTSSTIVERVTRQGTISGSLVTTSEIHYESYLGIPYAQPPVGSLRFMPPLHLNTLKNQTITARTAPPPCPQIEAESGMVIGKEDCLYLNIFIPTGLKSEGLAVMLFIHGGAFIKDSSDPDRYGPEYLLAEDVILVTINYRLGVLGFLTTLTEEAPGNQGLRDMMEAIHWVRSNIDDYGGDKERITVFGESAGSMAVSALITMPWPEGVKFQRAILQSGTLARPFFLQGLEDNRTESVQQFAESVQCQEDMVECLKTKEMTDLVSRTMMFPVHTVWQPVLDGELEELSVLPLDPLTSVQQGLFNGVDLIIGSNNGDGISQLGNTVLNGPEYYENLQTKFDEWAPLLMMGRSNPSLKDIEMAERMRYFYLGEEVFDSKIDVGMVELMTDNMYQAGGRRILEEILSRSQFDQYKIYQYIFTYVGSVTNAQIWFNISRPELGACHADDLFYLFSRSGDSVLVTEADTDVSQFLVKCWTSFAKSGDPNYDGSFGPIWTPVSRGFPDYLNIAIERKMEYPQSYEKAETFWKTILNPEPPLVQTLSGSLRGCYMTSAKGNCIRAFQGIPYAQPPVKDLRFKDPQPLSIWNEILDATQLGAKCPQKNGAYEVKGEASEDCLFLNIYTPCKTAIEKPSPVMVWIHGGASRRGSGGTYFYGPEYLLDGDVVLVTINYRLIPFGFLSMESEVMPGNQGLKDQTLALTWIKANIDRFGGDTERITIFGESAGSTMVLSHMVSPLSSGLFDRVIAQSGSPVDIFHTNKSGSYRKTVLDIATELECSVELEDEEILDCLQAVDSDMFYDTAMGISSATFGKVVDKDYSETPFFLMDPETSFLSGQFANIPLIIGFNKDEGIYQIPTYIFDPDKLQSLNDNWEVLGPAILFGKCCEFSESEVNKANNIREFYFGTEDISLETIQDLINMFSDKTFWVPAHTVTTIVSSHNKSPVYEYMFTHKGKFSYAEMLGLNASQFGVCHADELHYLFNPHLVEYPTLSGDDFAVRDLMLDMWLNFAASGKPSMSVDEGIIHWDQFDNKQPSYLNIDTIPRMEFTQEFQDRIGLWEELFPSNPIVRISGGQVVGTWEVSEQGKSFKSFKGIPYGKVVQRFTKSIPADAWSPAVLEAKSEGPSCPQKPSPSHPEMSEDCLSVNVYVPKMGENLPVMVWIHGGAYVGGSGANYFYGPEFIIDKDVILVTLNYRLGALGFLSLENDAAPGNLALWDQNLALRWVRENIEHFGGNPGQVTLFGESAGSFSVLYHIVSKQSSSLFSAAIAQSGAPFSAFWSPTFSEKNKPRKIATDLGRFLDCQTDTDEILLECLRSKTYQEIDDANFLCQEDFICSVDPWNAIVDTFSEIKFLQDTPENIVRDLQHNDVPIIIGLNSEEGIYSTAKYIYDNDKFADINDHWDIQGPLLIFDSRNASEAMKNVAEKVREFYLGGSPASMSTIHQVINMFSDIVFWSGAHRFIQLAVPRQVSPIYQYLLTYKATNSFADLVLGLDSESLGFGVCHADDLFHVFKNYQFELEFNEEDLSTRENMLSWWTDFAKVRVPAGDLWPRIMADSPGYLDISHSPHVEYGQEYQQRMEFWMQILDELSRH